MTRAPTVVTQQPVVGDTAGRLVVGRVRKPHGLKGECAVFPLTDEPDTVLAPGRSVWVVDPAGQPLAGPLVIARARAFHRVWLLAFQDHGSRSAVETLAGALLAVPADQLRPPTDNEVYLDELEGFAVQDLTGRALGQVTGYFELPAGLTLEVQGSRGEFLMPFRKEFVVAVDRVARRLTVELPHGLEEG